MRNSQTFFSHARVRYRSPRTMTMPEGSKPRYEREQESLLVNL